MSATDELRRLLDERGVKYYDMQNRGIWFGISEDGKDHKYEAFEQTDGLIEIDVFDLTPEQAIAATLGSGTCEYAIKDNMNETEGMGDVWIECSACHCAFDYYADEWLMNMHYCPNCGARVERREQ